MESSKTEDSEILRKILVTLEQTYNEEKKKEIEAIYNGIVDVITSSKAHIGSILVAIELVKHEVILQKIEQIRQSHQTQTLA